MLDKIVCHNESCRKIPSLIIDQNTPTVKIYCPEHEERILRIKDYINAFEGKEVQAVCLNDNSTIKNYREWILKMDEFVGETI